MAHEKEKSLPDMEQVGFQLTSPTGTKTLPSPCWSAKTRGGATQTPERTHKPAKCGGVICTWWCAGSQEQSCASQYNKAAVHQRPVSLLARAAWPHPPTATESESVLRDCVATEAIELSDAGLSELVPSCEEVGWKAQKHENSEVALAVPSRAAVQMLVPASNSVVYPNLFKLPATRHGWSAGSRQGRYNLRIK